MEDFNLEKQAIIIQARTGSERLPDKVVRPFYNNESILEIILNKLMSVFDKEKIIVATTDSEKDDTIIELCNKLSINTFRGSEQNVLLRMEQAAEHYNVEKIIRVCADNPFISLNLLTELATTHKNEDYLSFKMEDNIPVILSHLGLFAEATKRSTLKKVGESTGSKFYLEHVTNYIYSNEVQFDVKFLNLPSQLSTRNDLRFTIDTLEDFNMLKEIYTTMRKKYGENCSEEELIGLIEDRHLSIMSKEINKNKK